MLLLVDPPASPIWTEDLAATFAARPVEPRCDDGSRPLRADGSPNWSCERDGCGALERVCWLERLDYCFEDGEDTGECLWDEADARKQTCEGVFQCFKLWFTCDGTWGCESGTPCNKGSCSPLPSLKPEPEPGFALACVPGACAGVCDERAEVLWTTGEADTLRGSG